MIRPHLAQLRQPLRGPPAGRVGVRGRMPDRRHGMNDRPAVSLERPVSERPKA